MVPFDEMVPQKLDYLNDSRAGKTIFKLMFEQNKSKLTLKDTKAEPSRGKWVKI